MIKVYKFSIQKSTNIGDLQDIYLYLALLHKDDWPLLCMRPIGPQLYRMPDNVQPQDTLAVQLQVPDVGPPASPEYYLKI